MLSFFLKLFSVLSARTELACHEPGESAIVTSVVKISAFKGTALFFWNLESEIWN
jgi:hypothetical protein